MASSRVLATDVAELIVSLARVLGPERALRCPRQPGPDIVGAAVEQSDPSEFSMQTRDHLRTDPAL
jgi:hypothetical protein